MKTYGGVEVELHHSMSESVQILASNLAFSVSLYKREFRPVDCSAYNFYHAGFLLIFFFDTEDVGDRFLRNISWLFNGLHGVVSHNI
jgi:hypothetical protein